MTLLNNKLNNKWMYRHLEMARLVSGWSKDKSTKVGCVIVTPEGLPISWGYNGFAKGVEENLDRHIRPLKYHYVAHAERNAMDVCRRSVDGCVMFVTHVPCSSCAIGIIQCGIQTVIVDAQNGVKNNESYVEENDKWKESVEHSLAMFKEAGVNYREFDMEKRRKIYAQ